ncbi:hypothetical protein [Tenacibaculum sp. IB213877]|uniref:hypothetical protein n=1 Tax=Tenacibaculum sp. IB213877 TaxID=3097351 RepID=UPI002A5A2921|nr:hypothetical protein [Tenacibaculum sp. IB213877]MDY0779352.1 hypothetical protein [Tenacibaculum sp. IB213877]
MIIIPTSLKIFLLSICGFLLLLFGAVHTKMKINEILFYGEHINANVVKIKRESADMNYGYKVYFKITSSYNKREYESVTIFNKYNIPRNIKKFYAQVQINDTLKIKVLSNNTARILKWKELTINEDTFDILSLFKILIYNSLGIFCLYNLVLTIKKIKND